jgi:sialate O-acetylesterase
MLQLFEKIIILSFLLPLGLKAEVKLPRLISDGMVLQRNANVKIWGWSAAHEKITIEFRDTVYFLSGDKNGQWEYIFSNMQAGGPFRMIIKASNAITINNILIGDVWLISGQSNIELPMRRVAWVYEKEIQDAENSNIRQFKVPQKYNFISPHNDLESGEWVAVNKESIFNFSAVGYFYAKELYAKYNVPIGILNASLGGSPIEAWMSEESLKKFPNYYDEAQRFKDSALIVQIETADNTRIQNWYNKLGELDEGYHNSDKIWTDLHANTSDWDTMQVPGYWADSKIGSVNGVVWFKRNFEVSQKMVGVESTLILGRIVDADSVFVNGKFVGTTSYQYPPRRYSIPKGVLHEGENTVVVRVISNIGNGGFVLDKPYEISNQFGSINLKGTWQYKLGAVMEPLASQTFVRWKPLGLHNAMLNPLVNYTIKGVVWYQGESNADNPTEYENLLVALINNWRQKWNQGDFPFLIVQLPNYMETNKMPSESNWALMREAQLKTLAVPNTGMAVTIDIGEWNDIHPLNKKDVGIRLALAAQKVAYNEVEDGGFSPIYNSMNIEGDKVSLSFLNIGKGLMAKEGELKQFAIAGADKKFVWATTKIENNKVIVWSEKVKNPVAVRYAWADNPEGANLYNSDLLPASPFRTDDW